MRNESSLETVHGMDWEKRQKRLLRPLNVRLGRSSRHVPHREDAHNRVVLSASLYLRLRAQKSMRKTEYSINNNEHCVLMICGSEGEVTERLWIGRGAPHGPRDVRACAARTRSTAGPSARKWCASPRRSAACLVPSCRSCCAAHLRGWRWRR